MAITRLVTLFVSHTQRIRLWYNRLRHFAHKSTANRRSEGSSLTYRSISINRLPSSSSKSPSRFCKRDFHSCQSANPSLSRSTSMSMPSSLPLSASATSPTSLALPLTFTIVSSALSQAFRPRRRPASLLHRPPTAHPRRRTPQRGQYTSHRPVRQTQCPHQRHQRP